MAQMEARSIEIPKDVTVTLQEKTVEVSGEKGHVTRNFSLVPVNIKMKGDEIMVSALRPRRKESALVGTVLSHVQNMIKGVTKGFTYKLKIVFSHFPISVKVEGKKVIIGNFIGERSPRTARIMGDIKVNVKGDDVIVQGINIEDVSQTAANIEQATRVKKKDPRKFLDGIYIYEKLEGMTD
jgi:large subunit ribosomal protein L6